MGVSIRGHPLHCIYDPIFRVVVVVVRPTFAILIFLFHLFGKIVIFEKNNAIRTDASDKQFDQDDPSPPGCPSPVLAH